MVKYTKQNSSDEEFRRDCTKEGPAAFLSTLNGKSAAPKGNRHETLRQKGLDLDETLERRTAATEEAAHRVIFQVRRQRHETLFLMSLF